MVSIALYQPDIAQNLGTTFRTAACFGVEVDVIEPCGFPLDDRKFRRAGMDYISQLTYRRHASWEDFTKWVVTQNPASRLLLLSSKASVAYTDFQFQPHDVLVFGRETAGVPKEVESQCHHCLTIPMQGGMRSLNVAVSAGIVLSEAVRQIGRP